MRSARGLTAERRRLRRALQAALVSACAPAFALACNGSSAGGSGDASAVLPDVPDATFDAPVDAPIAMDTTSPGEVDAGADAATPDVAPAPPPLIPDARATGCYDGGYEIDGGPDAQDTCAFIYECGFPEGITSVGCTVALLLPDGGTNTGALSCWLVEGAGCEADAYSPGEGGAITIACSPCPAGGGRRPAGLARGASPATGRSALGAYLASLAFEEAAAVTAFERMSAELGAAGAPPSLLNGARAAARDEIRHARVMARHARARGGVVEVPRVRRAKVRSVVAMAVENAAEGCVRETFGALVMRWQAVHAADGGLRRAFRRIAEDEERHAALSWAVAGWLASDLDARGRARTRTAAKRALRMLAMELEREPDPSVARAAGLPCAAEARALLEGMARELSIETSWS